MVKEQPMWYETDYVRNLIPMLTGKAVRGISDSLNVPRIFRGEPALITTASWLNSMLENDEKKALLITDDFTEKYAKRVANINLSFKEAREFRKKLIYDIYPELGQLLDDYTITNMSKALNQTKENCKNLFGRDLYKIKTVLTEKIGTKQYYMLLNKIKKHCKNPETHKFMENNKKLDQLQRKSDQRANKKIPDIPKANLRIFLLKELSSTIDIKKTIIKKSRSLLMILMKSALMWKV